MKNDNDTVAANDSKHSIFFLNETRKKQASFTFSLDSSMNESKQARMIESTTIIVIAVISGRESEFAWLRSFVCLCSRLPECSSRPHVVV